MVNLMPRKNPRPAARKRAERLKAKQAAVAKFQRKARHLLTSDFRHGDAARLASIALLCGLESIHINRGRY